MFIIPKESDLADDNKNIRIVDRWPSGVSAYSLAIKNGHEKV